MAHPKMRQIEKRLSAACTRLEEWNLQMVQPRAPVAKLADEFDEAEKEHRRLVQSQHTSVEPPSNKPEATPAVPLAAILDGSFTKALIMDPAELLGSCEDYELSESHQRELELWGEELTAGMKHIASTLFSKAAEEAPEIKGAHR
ncbi:unnamed protein product, partial [Prorocentrum cordatum]